MGTTIIQKVRFTRALQSPSFALLWIGQVISAMGDGTYNIALAWQVLLLTRSATEMGIVLSVQFIPLLLFTLFGGVAADRLPRRSVMLWSDVGRAGIMFIIAVLGWAHLLQLWHLIVTAFLFGLVRGFFDPAYQSIRPQLVEKEALPSANALTGLSRQMSRLVGPSIGAICVSLAGPATAFAFNGVTFLASAVFLFALKMPPRQEGAALKREENSQHRRGLMRRGESILKDLGEGLQFVLSVKWLWATILVASLINLGLMGPLTVILPKLVQQVYKGNVWVLGMLTTAGAIGTLLATFIIGHMGQLKHRGLLAYFSLALSSFALIWFGLPFPFYVRISSAIAAEFIIGFFIVIFNILWVTILQELVPIEKLGRVSSIDSFGSTLLLPVAYSLAGVFSDHFGEDSVFIIGGILTLVLSLIGLSIREVRQLE